MISAKTSLNRAALKGGAATLVLAMLAAPVAGLAQTAAGTPVAAAALEDEGTIIVTGSLIKNPNLVMSSPVNVVGALEIAARQATNAEQLLRDLPGVVPSIGSAVNNGNGGASFVNLRGIGSQRNLALIDGDRIVPGTSAGQFDLNNVPLALVQRVDILTGGASTTYGADAVSGVVNFVIRKDFTGVDLQVTNGLTERGDGQTFRADLTVGGNFADGRGNAVLSVGYQKSDPVSQGNRDFSAFQINSASGRAAGGSPTNTPTTFVLNGDTGFEAQNNGTGTGFVTPDADGFNFAPYNIYQTPFQRFNLLAQANYEIADNIEIYGRGMFSKNSVKTIIAPSGIFGEELSVNINNPFISASQRATICSQIAGLDCSTGSTATAVLPAVYRRTTELGPRTSDYRTTLFDFKVGVRGDITDSISFDLSGAYGESNNNQSQSGYVLKSRVQQALLADNASSCRVTSSNCVPLNLFGGPGSITPAMVDFINGRSYIGQDTSLGQVRGVINGDLGFSSPSATNAIGFAVGAEYRKYGYTLSPDSLAQVPGELGGGGGAVLPYVGGYSVKEVFGEINAPLVEDKPFFELLSVEAGIRQSKYSNTAPNSPSFNATTWKVGGTWSPTSDLKIRGGYQHAVRAPSIGELFAPSVTGLTNLADDPCSGSKPTGNAILSAVCIAQGAAAGQLGSIADPAAGQANSTGGGNPNLTPEKANSWTVGAVFSPSFLPGFSLTVDYFNIKVTDAITSPTPADVINACFDGLSAASATSAACTTIRRNPATGRLSGPSGTTFGLPVPSSNLGKIATNGIDFSAAYTTDIGFAKLSLNGSGTYTISNKFQATPTSKNRECVGYYSVNCNAIQPKFTSALRTTLDFDWASLNLRWRHMGSMAYEPGLSPRFNGTVTGFGPLVGNTYNFNKIAAANYFDLGAGFNVMNNITFNLLVSNLFDRAPPIVGGTIGGTGQNSGNTYPSAYDALGRRYSATIGLRF